MSIVHCNYCDKMIDTDFNAEHFITDVPDKCEQEIEDSEWNKLSKKAQYINQDKDIEAFFKDSQFVVSAEWKLNQLKELGDQIEWTDRDLRDALNFWLLQQDDKEYHKKRNLMLNKKTEL